jgi:hypothetical protein
MGLKFLNIDYLVASSGDGGHVFIISDTGGITSTPLLSVENGNVTTNANFLINNTSTFFGNLTIAGNSSIVFGDGTSIGSTNGVSIGGSTGAIQFNSDNIFAGSSDLYWDSGNIRLGVGTNEPKSTLQIKNIGFESTDVMTLDTSPIILDSFSASDYRSCHYIIQVTDTINGWYQTSQILMVHDNFIAFRSEYNIVTNNINLGTFDADLNSGMVRLFFTADNATPKDIKVIRTSIHP